MHKMMIKKSTLITVCIFLAVPLHAVIIINDCALAKNTVLNGNIWKYGNKKIAYIADLKSLECAIENEQLAKKELSRYKKKKKQERYTLANMRDIDVRVDRSVVVEYLKSKLGRKISRKHIRPVLYTMKEARYKKISDKLIGFYCNYYHHKYHGWEFKPNRDEQRFIDYFVGLAQQEAKKDVQPIGGIECKEVFFSGILPGLTMAAGFYLKAFLSKDIYEICSCS